MFIMEQVLQAESRQKTLPALRISPVQMEQIRARHQSLFQASPLVQVMLSLTVPSPLVTKEKEAWRVLASSSMMSRRIKTSLQLMVLALYKSLRIVANPSLNRREILRLSKLKTLAMKVVTRQGLQHWIR